MASVKGGGPAWLIVPLLVGALVAGGLYVLLEVLPRQGMPPPAPPDAPLAVDGVYAFPAGPRGDAPSEVLVVRPGNTTEAQMRRDAGPLVWMAPPGNATGTGQAVPHPCAPAAQPTWLSSGVGILVAGAAPCDPPPCNDTPTWQASCVATVGVGPGTLRPAMDGRRFGNGTWSANVTVFAFQPNGLLFASNAPDLEVARFRTASGFVALPRGTYYLGPGQAPAGQVVLPAALSSLGNAVRDALDAQPVGGIAVAHVTDGLVHDLVGILHVTARIDDLPGAGQRTPDAMANGP